MNKAQELFNKSDFAQAYYKSLEEMIEDRDGNVQDNIQEYADTLVDIYYHDLYKWIPENHEYVEQAIDEFGWEGCGGALWKAIQMGQYQYYSEQINEEVEEIIEAYEEIEE